MIRHLSFSQPARFSKQLMLSGVVALALLAALPARAADLWTPLGPSGGTIAAIAVDPADGNTVYAGSLEAGVLKSTNGGRAWRPAGLDGGVRHLAVAPGSRTVYAETGFGFFRSRDGAATWTDLSGPLLATAGTPFLLSLALSPTPGTIYAVSSSRVPDLESRVLKSTDGGDSWRTIWTPPAGAIPLGVFTDPSDPAVVLIGTVNGIYWSADAGATWNAASASGDVYAIAAEQGPRHRLLAASTNGDPRIPRTAIQVSSDRGRTWRPRDTLKGLPLSFLLADRTAPGAFVALDLVGDLFRTTDAGLHWTAFGLVPRSGTPGSVLDLALDPSRPGVAFVGVNGERFGRGLWKTASYGASWAPFLRGLFAGDFATVAPDAAHPEILRAGAGEMGGDDFHASPHGLWTSFDRGATWLQTALPGNTVWAIAATSKSLFAASPSLGLQRSDDGGLHWSRSSLPSTDVEAVVATGEKPGTLYALAYQPTSGLGIDVSVDNGATWTDRTPPGTAASTLAVAPGAPATLYINASNRILGPGNPDALRRSTDRGLTWTTLLTVSGGFLSAIGLDPADPRRIAVSFEHVDAESQPVTSLLWTADGGATWNPGDLSPHPYRVFTLLPDPLVPHGFLAGTGEGAFQSADGGATWTPLGDGLPRARTHLSLDPASPTTVYAATEGGGIYRLERTAP